MRQCYDMLAAKYQIDTDRVILSGFSGGAMISINIMLNNTFPVAGFIALCPHKPDDFTQENVERMSQNNIRGVIIEGALSGEVADQQEMLALLRKQMFPVNISSLKI